MSSHTLRPLARLAVLAATAALFGCASGPQVDPQVTAALSSRNVNATTYNKVYNARPLDYDDIVNLVEKKVPTQVVIGYLQSTEKVYNFTYSQLGGLRAAGATPQLLNYLSETQGFYGYNPPAAAAATKKRQLDKYYNDPAYQNEQPFAYNEPIVDDWYDSAYEESLYSPFSMD
ncbi:MAG: hypothetical protein PHC88_16400 [Terrimicrobiaceae bacterium]|nr:hypothetical protein [Terrimicrobiaceae bacterium]